jgi:Asp-tRNA(Asn)/Glu-tRNA(Gln) amidotransferase A subunit family amidase
LPGWKIRELVGSREVSPVEVTDHFLARIEELDPKVHPFYRVDFAGAREQARRAEQAVLSGAELGPLHGVPMASVDWVKVAGFPSAAWDIPMVGNDWIPVERLRTAGAVIVGTTKTYFFEPEDRPRNPWDLSKDPGNSSRGSAAAASAAMVPITVGGDGAGSTRAPAALSGVVGVHPTRGLILNPWTRSGVR